MHFRSLNPAPHVINARSTFQSLGQPKLPIQKTYSEEHHQTSPPHPQLLAWRKVSSTEESHDSPHCSWPEWNRFLLFKLLSLCYFAVAAITKTTNEKAWDGENMGVMENMILWKSSEESFSWFGEKTMSNIC